MASIFGIETPEEAQERVRQRFLEANQRVAALGQSASPGQRLGASLSNIFGGTVQKFIDTRSARKDETRRLIEAGMDPEAAKARAKADTPMQYREVRQAQKLQDVSAGADDLVQNLIAEGIAPNAAQGAGMLFLSQKLRELGMRQEASALAVQAGTLFTEEEERVADLNKVRAETDRERSSTAEALQRMHLAATSDDDTFLKFNEKTGKVEDFKSIAAGDLDARVQARKDGYINMGNSPFGIQLDKEVFGGVAPINTEDLGFQFNMLDALDLMETVAPDVGPTTPFKALLADRGIDLFGSGELIEPVAVQRAMRAGIQSIVKGIPSNYDASVFEAMIPNLFRFQDGDYYQAQIDVLKNQTRSLIELAIAAHKGSKQPMPRHILMLARRSGIDVDSIQGISGEDLDEATRAHERSTLKAFRGINAVAPGTEEPGADGDYSEDALIERFSQ